MARVTTAPASRAFAFSLETAYYNPSVCAKVSPTKVSGLWSVRTDRSSSHVSLVSSKEQKRRRETGGIKSNAVSHALDLNATLSNDTVYFYFRFKRSSLSPFRSALLAYTTRAALFIRERFRGNREYPFDGKYRTRSLRIAGFSSEIQQVPPRTFCAAGVERAWIEILECGILFTGYRI